MKANEQQGDQALSTHTASTRDKEMLDKAQELVRLFQDAIRLGYSITFSPERLQALITICEHGHLIKTRGTNDTTK